MPQTYEGQAPDWALFQRDPAAYAAWQANQAAVAARVSQDPRNDAIMAAQDANPGAVFTSTPQGAPVMQAPSGQQTSLASLGISPTPPPVNVPTAQEPTQHGGPAMMQRRPGDDPNARQGFGPEMRHQGPMPGAGYPRMPGYPGRRWGGGYGGYQPAYNPYANYGGYQDPTYDRMNQGAYWTDPGQGSGPQWGNGYGQGGGYGNPYSGGYGGQPAYGGGYGQGGYGSGYSQQPGYGNYAGDPGYAYAGYGGNNDQMQYGGYANQYAGGGGQYAGYTPLGGYGNQGAGQDGNPNQYGGYGSSYGGAPDPAMNMVDYGGGNQHAPAQPRTRSVPLAHQVNPMVWDSLGPVGQQLAYGAIEQTGQDPQQYEYDMNRARPRGSSLGGARTAYARPGSAYGGWGGF